MQTAGLSRSAAFSAYQRLWKAADWLFPPNCAGCDRVGYSWCPECDSRKSPIQEPVCLQCGMPVSKVGICDRCLKENPPFDGLRSYSEYAEPMRSAIIRMKDHPDYGLGLALSAYLLKLFLYQAWQIDLITPVPINNNHARERGYNQTDLFAYPLALSLRIPYSSKAISRIRQTRSQVGLTAAERSTNVSGAFGANRFKVNGKSVLVVDDVATTGSSISACAQALKDAGAIRVYGLTLARPIMKDPTLIPADV